MEELLEKIENLKTSINNEETVKRIKVLNNEIAGDKKLLEMLEEYKVRPTESLKKEIYNNELYREYKKSETDINILIMTINQKLKEINNKRSCR